MGGQTISSKQTDRLIGGRTISGKQTDRQTAGQTEFVNFDIDSKICAYGTLCSPFGFEVGDKRQTKHICRHITYVMAEVLKVIVSAFQLRKILIA